MKYITISLCWKIISSSLLMLERWRTTSFFIYSKEMNRRWDSSSTTLYRFCTFLTPSLFSPSIPTGDFYSLLSKLLGEREDVHLHKYNPTEKAESESDLVAEIANVVQKKDLGPSDARENAEQEERGNAILVRDRIHKFHRLESTLRPAESKVFSLQQPQPGEGTWQTENTGGASRTCLKE